ncbi:NAD(P)/FAD-dependent oxidoreductase [Amaricoccus tamworthensis]|uniref:NAD(P)/FAD-dependent oxidoreductase n=1 Tax=Amaricoccus tamworthensis TaxID=57002 RepID=UPI003C79A2CF
MTGIVIIGAGESGVRAAFELRQLGYGGEVTLIGEEASLPYERPPLSKETGEPKPIRPASAYEEAGITCRFGMGVSGILPDQHRVVLETGGDLSYERLLIATGARARVFPGIEKCLTLRTDRDAKAILAAITPGARIGIIGGGFIGLELASTARMRGAEVTVIEAGPRLLGRAVPEEIASVLTARHEAEGVQIKCGASVECADARHIRLADGFDTTFDVVIAGVGASPNTQLAEQAGLTVNNGIVVDSAFRTSDTDIYAAGDCCNFEWRGVRVRLESWRAAQDQGAHAAAAILGATDTYGRVPWFWSDQYDLTLQLAGLFDMTRPVVKRETADDQRIVFQCDGTGGLSAVAGIGTGNSVAKDIRIFEKLIERGGPVEPEMLADPAQNLKRLLRAG